MIFEGYEFDASYTIRNAEKADGCTDVYSLGRQAGKDVCDGG